MDERPDVPEVLLPEEALEDAPAAAARPGWARTVLVVLPLLVGLLVAGSVGGRLLWSEVGEADTADAGVTCWDGERAEGPSDCSRPRGVEGMAWVLPSFRPDEQDCVDELEEHPGYTRPTMWTCELTLAGRPVAVTYSELRGRRAGQRLLDRLHGEDVRSRSRLGGSPVLRWAPTQGADGRWRASVLLRDAPYAVTSTADSPRDARRALDRRVRVRPPEARPVADAG